VGTQARRLAASFAALAAASPARREEVSAVLTMPLGITLNQFAPR
jgi:hypothetical protein